MNSEKISTFLPQLLRWSLSPEAGSRGRLDAYPSCVMHVEIHGFSSYFEGILDGDSDVIPSAWDAICSYFQSIVDTITECGGDVLFLNPYSITAAWVSPAIQTRDFWTAVSNEAADCAGKIMANRRSFHNRGLKLRLSITLMVDDIVILIANTSLTAKQYVFMGSTSLWTRNQRCKCSVGDVIVDHQIWSFVKDSCLGEELVIKDLVENDPDDSDRWAQDADIPLASLPLRQSMSVLFQENTTLFYKITDVTRYVDGHNVKILKEHDPLPAQTIRSYLPPWIDSISKSPSNSIVSKELSLICLSIHLPKCMRHDPDPFLHVLNSVHQIILSHNGSVIGTQQMHDTVVVVSEFGMSDTIKDAFAVKAVQASMFIREKIYQEGFRCSIGVGTSITHVLSVSAKSRRHFLLLGTGFETAKDLSKMTTDDILADERTMQLSETGIVYEQTHEITIPGKIIEIRPYRPVREVSQLSLKTRLDTEAVVGRDDQLAFAKSMVVELLSGKKRLALFIEGRHGYGKTSFIRKLVQDVEHLMIKVYEGHAQVRNEFLPYHAWRDVIYSILVRSNRKSSKGNQTNSQPKKQTVAITTGAPLSGARPVLSPLPSAGGLRPLAMPAKLNPAMEPDAETSGINESSTRATTELEEAADVDMIRWIEDSLSSIDSELVQHAHFLEFLFPLDAKAGEEFKNSRSVTKQQSLISFLTRILRKSTQQPSIIILEDVHWMDSSSWNLFHLAFKALENTLFILTTTSIQDIHPGNIRDLMLYPTVTTMGLGDLSSEDLQSILCKRLETKSVPPQLLQILDGATDGSPLFPVELANVLTQTFRVFKNGKRILPSQNESGMLDLLPRTVQSLISCRLSSLESMKADILQCAAAVGSTFPLSIIKAMFRDVPSATLKGHFQDLIANDILEVDKAEKTRYRFTHFFLFSYIFSNISQKKLGPLSEKIDGFLKSSNPGIFISSLERANHAILSSGSNRSKGALEVMAIAAQACMSIHAFNEAIRYWEQYLSIHVADEMNDHYLSSSKIKHAIGYCHLQAGRMPLARLHHFSALRLLQRTTPTWEEYSVQPPGFFSMLSCCFPKKRYEEKSPAVSQAANVKASEHNALLSSIMLSLAEHHFEEGAFDDFQEAIRKVDTSYFTAADRVIPLCYIALHGATAKKEYSSTLDQINECIGSITLPAQSVSLSHALIAKCHLSVGNFNAARVAIDRSLKTLQAEGDFVNCMESLRFLMFLESFQGRKEDIMTAAELILAYGQERTDRCNKQRHWIDKAQILMENNQIAEAWKILRDNTRKGVFLQYLRTSDILLIRALCLETAMHMNQPMDAICHIRGMFLVFAQVEEKVDSLPWSKELISWKVDGSSAKEPRHTLFPKLKSVPVTHKFYHPLCILSQACITNFASCTLNVGSSQDDSTMWLELCDVALELLQTFTQYNVFARPRYLLLNAIYRHIRGKTRMAKDLLMEACQAAETLHLPKERALAQLQLGIFESMAGKKKLEPDRIASLLTQAGYESLKEVLPYFILIDQAHRDSLMTSHENHSVASVKETLHQSTADTDAITENDSVSAKVSRGWSVQKPLSAGTDRAVRAAPHASADDAPEKPVRNTWVVAAVDDLE